MPYESYGAGGGGGGVTPVNDDAGLELFGFTPGATGLTSVAANASANTKGAWTTLAGTPSGVEYSEILIYAGISSNAAARCAVDLSFDAGGTVAIPDWVVHAHTSSGTRGIQYPLKLTPPNTASTVKARISCQTGGVTLLLGAAGLKKQADSSPQFTICEAIGPVTAGDTRAGSVNITLGGGYVTLIDPTANDIGALAPFYGTSPTAAPSLTQHCVITIAVGAAGAEVPLCSFPAYLSSVNPSAMTTWAPVVKQAIAAGARLSARADAPANGTPDVLRVGLHVFR